MNNLAVIVPSRGRPEAVAEMVRSFNSTCTATTELVFAVDEDDPKLAEYTELAYSLTFRIPATVVVIDNPRNMVTALNKAAVFCAGHVYAVGFMGDDHRPRTRGWDSAYLKALQELGSGLVYGNDLIQGEKLPTQVAMTSNIVEALGYMALPTLRHMYVDNFWYALGKAAGCLKYLPDVTVEHLHPVAGKAEWDEGYRRVNAESVYAEDHQTFNAYLATGFTDDVLKVVALQGKQVQAPQ